MPSLDLPDVSLHYEVTGEGPPLMLIAGMLSDSTSWAPLIPHLAPHFTVISMDCRTTGRTTPADAPASPVLWAQDALALMDHLGHPACHVAGHSLGGNIAWVIGAVAPERVASCTMIASAPLNLLRNLELFRTLIDIRRSDAPPDSWIRLFLQWIFTPTFYQTPGVIEAAIAQALAYPHSQSADAMERQLTAVLNADPTPFQARPKVPLYALLAEDDLLIPLEMARATLQGVYQEVLPGSGHAPHWDAPESVATHLRRFIASVS